MKGNQYYWLGILVLAAAIILTWQALAKRDQASLANSSLALPNPKISTDKDKGKATLMSQPDRPLSPDECRFDAMDGTISGIPPTLSNKEISELLPFYTGITNEGGEYNAGGGVFFLDHNIYFYTGANTIELRYPCKIDVVDDLFHKDLDYFKRRFGEPEFRADPPVGEFPAYIFPTKYGTLSISPDTSTKNIRTIRARFLDEWDAK